MSGASGRAADLSPQKRALLDLLLREELGDAGVEDRIPRRTVLSPVPQSFAQRRLWLLEALQPGTAVYTVRTILRLTGAVDRVALARSIDELVRRHEALRTTFTLRDGEPMQVIAPHLTVPLDLVEIDGGTAEDREAAAGRIASEEGSRPFDLEAGPLFRCSLLRLAADHHILLLTLHHIVADGWSLGIILRELSAIYTAMAAGGPSPLPEPAIQYPDYAVWQRAMAATTALREQLAYWTRQLANLPALVLPADRPRPAILGLAAERQHVILSKELTDRLTALSGREGVTLFMTLLAAFQTVLARWSGQDDFAIGTPIANRVRAETEDVVGFFLNTLILRADLQGDPSFLDLLARVRETTLGAYANQDLPFERLLEALRPPRDPSRTPVFQVFFNLLNFADERLNRPVVVADAAAEEDLAQFDLTLYAGEHDHQLQLQLVYRTDLFDRATGTRLLGYLSTLLAAVVEQPARRVSALPIVSPEERQRLRRQRNRLAPRAWFEPFATAAIEQSLADRFADVVRRHGERIAVRWRGIEWTYADLDARVERVSRAVQEAAPGEPGHIGLLCGHHAPMLAAVLGVLRAGHAYVPLDTSHPVDRLTALVADAQIQALIADHANLRSARALAADRLPIVLLDAALDEATPARRVAGRRSPGSPDSIAYILYTSGSTGRPKGVIQSHRNVLHHVRAYTNALHLGPADRLSLLASYGFDAAVMDIYGALLNGAALCLFDLRHDGAHAVSSWLQDEQITIFHSTPAVYRQVFDASDAGQELSSLRIVVLGGEEVRSHDVEAFRRHCPPDCLFVNGLGPTESTLALQYILDHRTPLSRRTAPVGYPVDATDVLLLNESGEEVDVYGVGTIVIRSAHIALGYWRRPELTRAAFRPDPLDARHRLYDTGDLGRLLPDGAIEFAGRRDRQIKIRGQRVEPGEVEAVLLAHPAVRRAVVVDAEHPASGVVLVANVVFRDQPAPSPIELRAWLRERLPAALMPAAVVGLPELPLTITGKVDYRALPKPDFSVRESAARVPPRTGLESTLAALAAGVLGQAAVGTTDDFFELGGDSLLAMQLLARVRSTLHVEVPLRTVFEQPTIAGLAQSIERLTVDRGGRATIAVQPRDLASAARAPEM